MRIFNADGSEAEMCGNGIRCLARYAVEEGMVPAGAKLVTIETGAGVLTLELFREEGVVRLVRVDMGPPISIPPASPRTLKAPARSSTCRSRPAVCS